MRATSDDFADGTLRASVRADQRGGIACFFQMISKNGKTKSSVMRVEVFGDEKSSVARPVDHPLPTVRSYPLCTCRVNVATSGHRRRQTHELMCREA